MTKLQFRYRTTTSVNDPDVGWVDAEHFTVREVQNLEYALTKSGLTDWQMEFRTVEVDK